MTITKRFRSRGLLVALGLALLPASGCERVLDTVYSRAASRLAQGDREDWLTDGALHVVLCGTGTPVADPDRAGPCTAVIAGNQLFLFDTGPGSWENVQLWQLPRARLRAVLLTHFHSDHIGDLGEVGVQSWIGGRTAPLDVFGPPGVTQVVDGFRSAYAFDAQYRTAHHGSEAMPAAGSGMVPHPIDLPAADAAAVVLEQDGVRITAFSVDHAPVAPAFGYRVEYGGRSVVISGDTKKSGNLVRHSQKADLLVHEGLAGAMISKISQKLTELGSTRMAKLTADIVDYHTTPVEVAEEAKAAEVRMLVFTHMVPAPQNRVLAHFFLEGTSEAWSGPIVLGEDGMHFRLPAQSEAIEKKQL